MYTVASPRGGGQLPNPNECNSTPTSETRVFTPSLYIDVDERGHRLRFFHARRLLPPPPRWQN